MNRQITNLNELQGTNMTDWQKSLGNPALIRPEGNSQIWLYKSNICNISLFFALNNGVQQLKFADLRPADAKKPKPSLEECLNAIKGARK